MSDADLVGYTVVSYRTVHDYDNARDHAIESAVFDRPEHADNARKYLVDKAKLSDRRNIHYMLCEIRQVLPG